jgi:hypothetical protein
LIGFERIVGTVDHDERRRRRIAPVEPSGHVGHDGSHAVKCNR